VTLSFFIGTNWRRAKTFDRRPRRAMRLAADSFSTPETNLPTKNGERLVQ
jgi:hypothetical protein